MGELRAIDDLVEAAAAVAFRSGGQVRRVMTKPAVASDGEDALDITIVLKRGTSSTVTGDDVIDALMEIRNALEAAGEDYVPIVRFATEEELQADDDLES